MVAQNRLLGDSGITGGSLETDGIQTLGSLYRSRLAGEPLSYISKYGVKGVSPTLVTNFLDGEYLLGGVESTFGEAFIGTSPKLTYSTTSNSTMVNSAGNIVWAPHNLVTYSEDFSQWADHVGLTLDSSTTTDPLGGSTAYTYSGFSGAANNRLSQIFSLAVGVSSTLAIWLKGTAGETIELELDTNGAPENTITFTGDWQLETISNSNPTTGRVRVIYRTGNTADVVSVWGAHLYRSDLGGMAQVPQSATGFETYVPTNGSAEYLPRVGHHVYNGTTWVNEGLLIESEARTNLFNHSEAITGTDVGNGTSALDGATAQGANAYQISLSTSTIDTGATQGFYLYGSLGTGEHAFSVLLKAGQYTDIRIRRGNGNVDTTTIGTVNLSTGVATNVDGELTVEPQGNGWYRVSWTDNVNNASSTGFAVKPNSTTHGTSNGTDYFLLSQPQIEAAPTPSSYMPTSGGTYTRTVQSLEVPPAEFGWPEPEYIGSDLAVEGSHSSLGSDWSYANGVYTASGAQTASQNIVRFDNIGIEEGKVYSVSCDIANRTAGNIGVKLNGGVDVAFSTNGTHTATLVGLNLDGFQVLEQNGFDGDVSNISVREINPLSVSIQMDGRMTYADEGISSTGMLMSWSDVANDVRLQMRLDTAVSTGRIAGIHRASTPSIFQSTPAGSLSSGILVPMNVSGRFGSTFLQVALDGVSTAANTTPTALPDLSNTNLQIAQDFMGTVATFRQFAGDIGDAGLETSSDPGPSLSLTFDGSSTSSFVIN